MTTHREQAVEEWRAFLIAHARDLHGCEHDFGGDEMRLRQVIKGGVVVAVEPEHPTPIVGPDMGTERRAFTVEDNPFRAEPMSSERETSLREAADKAERAARKFIEGTFDRKDEAMARMALDDLRAALAVRDDEEPLPPADPALMGEAYRGL